MYVVYALIDPRNNQVRYVGITDDVYERFAQHLRCDGTNSVKDTWIQELKALNIMVVMQSLQIVGTEDQAKKREAYWMRHYYELGMPLTNQVMPMYQDILTVDPIPMVTRGYPRLKANMTPDEQRIYIERLWSTGLSQKTIIQQVEKYIPSEYVRIVLSECLRSQHSNGATEDAAEAEISLAPDLRSKEVLTRGSAAYRDDMRKQAGPAHADGAEVRCCTGDSTGESPS